MAPPGTYPIQDAEAELGLKTLGPPWPPPPFGVRRVDRPLRHAARCCTSRATNGATTRAPRCLGILLERASGQPLETFLRERLFEPLGMVDTSFSVAEAEQSRFTTAYMPDVVSRRARGAGPAGRRVVERAAGHGQRGGHARLDASTTTGRSCRCCWRADGTTASSCSRPPSVDGHDHGPPDRRPARLGADLPRRARRLGLRHGGARPARRAAARAVGLRLERRHRHGLDAATPSAASPGSCCPRGP